VLYAQSNNLTNIGIGLDWENLVGTLDATNNWWGTTDPTAVQNLATYGNTNPVVNINFAPWLAVAGASISGQVFDPVTGSGVGGVPVLLQPTSGAPATQMTTDSAGFYSFSSLAPGSYVVSEPAVSGRTQTSPASGQYLLTVNIGDYLTGVSFGSSDLHYPYLQHTYQDMVGQGIDPSLLTWSNAQLDAGAWPGNVIWQFAQTLPYRVTVVTNLYQSALGVPPKPQQLGQALSILATGGTMTEVRAELYASPDFYKVCGRNDRAWVKAVFLAAWGKRISRSKLDYYLNLLQHGASHLRVARMILSLQNVDVGTTLVQSWWLQYIHRFAAPAELNPYVQMLRGGWPENLVLAVLLTSPTYMAQVP
jgi:hypothetical protein